MSGNWQFFERVNVNRNARIVNRKMRLRCNDSTNLESRTRAEQRKALLGSGDNSVVAPPVPIPNTEVKRCSPDGSTAIGRARVGRRQNKMPGELLIGHFAFFPMVGPRVPVNAHSRSRTCIRRAPRLDFAT